MGIEEFANQVLMALQPKLQPEGITAKTVITTKNNQTDLHGILLERENSTISYTAYLESYFKEYQKGLPLSSIVNRILNLYHQFKVPPFNDFSKFEKYKGEVIFTLINSKFNKDLLDDIPHIPFLDLAIVFRLLLSVVGGDSTTILITKKHVEIWGISLSDLYSLARANTPKIFPHYLLSPQESWELAMGSGVEMPEDSPASFIQTLTTKSGINGAGCMLYENLLEDIGNGIGENYYVLPCSINELLLIPESQALEKEEFYDLIRSANSDVVLPEDILSDHPYYYDRSTQQLSCA